MRQKLGEHEGSRKKFIATFSRLGKKMNFRGRSEETILLTNVVDAESNTIITDHVWFTLSKGFEKILSNSGHQIEFEARVVHYTKGYVNTKYKIKNRSIDFKLSHPTKIKLTTKVTK